MSAEIKTQKKLVEFIGKFTKLFFNPFFCNQKPVFEEKGGKFKIYKGSSIGIPKGTRITIFVNADKNDPESDCFTSEVTTVTEYIMAVSTQTVRCTRCRQQSSWSQSWSQSIK